MNCHRQLSFAVLSNTIVNDNGHLTGHITDGIGFMQALKDNNIDVIGKKNDHRECRRRCCSY